MKEEKPAITIIVPVYNAINYLDRCVKSIINQRFDNFELLLVDDGSIDGSGNVCDSYTLKDSRIKVFHKQNGGVSSARNIGLRNAKGEFLTFVDSDDWIDDDYLLNLYDQEFDLTISGYKEHRHYTISEIKYLNNSCSDIIQLSDFIVLHNVLPMLFNPWRKLFKTSIIHKNKIVFDENTSLGEDSIFVFSYLLYIQNINIIQNTGYNYTFGVGLCHRYFSKSMYLYTLNAIKEKIKAIRFKELISNKYADEMIVYFNTYFGSQIIRANYNHGYNKKVRKTTLEYLSKNFIPWNPIIGNIFKLNRFSGSIADIVCVIINKTGRLR